jgi:hypothetical protein
MTNPSAAVLETLQNACSQNADVLKPAEKQLQEWEIHPGFYSILSVSVNNSTNINIINKTNSHFSPQITEYNVGIYMYQFAMHLDNPDSLCQFSCTLGVLLNFYIVFTLSVTVSFLKYIDCTSDFQCVIK